MKRLKEYLVSFADLKIGEHCFDFHVDNAFFENFPESEITQSDVKIDLVLDKQERMLVLYFDIEGVVTVLCDRCLDEFRFPVKTNEKLIVKFGKEYEELSEDVIVLPEKTHSIDLQQHLYEYIMLTLPIQRIHPDLPDGTGCNQTMLERLNRVNNNSQADPRWDALRDLINN